MKKKVLDFRCHASLLPQKAMHDGRSLLCPSRLHTTAFFIITGRRILWSNPQETMGRNFTDEIAAYMFKDHQEQGNGNIPL